MTRKIDKQLRTGIHVYEDGVLCNPSSKSKSIHLFTGTWLEGKNSLKHNIVTFLKKHISNPKQAGVYEKIIR